jgi:Family of unknown function (DUF6483)
MIRQDYIMRMIEQLVKVLTKILFNKENNNYQEAFNNIDRAFKNILGLDYNLINSLSGKDIISLLDFSKDNSTFSVKCIVIAKLLKENGVLKELIKREETESRYDYQKALRLYLEGILRNNNQEFSFSDYYPDIKDLAKKLGNKIPADTRLLLSKFNEQFGESGRDF